MKPEKELHLSLGYLIASGLWQPRYSLPKERHQWWNSPILYNLYSIFVLWQVTSSTVQVFVALFAYEDLNFKERVMCGCNSWLMIFTSLKVCYFSARRKNLRRLVEKCYETNKKIEESTSKESHEILRNRARYGHRLSLTCFTITMVASLGLWIGPHLEMHLLSNSPEANNPNREKIFFERYGIPAMLYFPIDVKKYANFCNIYELLNCTLHGFSVSASDVFVYSILNDLWAQYEVLEVMFKNLNDTSSQFEIGDTNLTKKTNKMNKTESGLLKAIRHHDAILKLGGEIESFCNPFMALQILMSAGVICFTVYQLSQGSAIFSPVFIAMTQYFTMGIVIAFTVCYFADGVRSKSNAVSFAIYSSDWLQQNGQTRRHLLLSLHLSQQKLRFTALKTLNISLELFVQILKQSYSLFALLKRAESM